MSESENGGSVIAAALCFLCGAALVAFMYPGIYSEILDILLDMIR